MVRRVPRLSYLISAFAVILLGCSNEVSSPTVSLSTPAFGSVQCYLNEKPDLPSIAFEFDEKNSAVKDLIDKGQKYKAEYNAASIFLHYERHNIMDSDACYFFFNRISGDGGLYCMLAETDMHQEEFTYKCEPFGDRKF